jgi:acyl-CoA thioester hydrolase
VDATHFTDFPVVVECPVAWGEMDSYQHVNNAVYFRYFENARLEYFRQMGWFEYERETGIGPILHSTSARFRRPLAYPDTVRIGARIGTVEADRCVMEYRVVSLKLDAIAADGQGVIVAYDYREKRKAAFTDELRRRIAALEAQSTRR